MNKRAFLKFPEETAFLAKLSFGVFQKVDSKSVALADVPLYPNPEHEGAFGCSPVPRVHSDVPGYQNRNEGTFAKTTLFRNHPFVSSGFLKAPPSPTPSKTPILLMLSFRRF